MTSFCRELVLRLGKAQPDVAMFGRQDEGPLIDDAEFIPFIESVLTAFETADIESQVVEELCGEYAYSRYDRACQEADPSFTTSEDIRLTRSDLLGPRRISRRRR